MVEVKVPLNSAVRLISPRVTALITTVDKQGRVNAAPYSWIYPFSYNPPLVGIGVGGDWLNQSHRRGSEYDC